MSARGKAFGQRFVAEVNKGKAAMLATVDELYAPDVVAHIGDEEIHGLKNLKKWYSDQWDAFPDLEVTFDDRFVKGDKAATRFTAIGTHTGEVMGIPPTNKKVTWWGISIFRRAGGKIVEEWLLRSARYDALGIMQQFGLTPTPKTKE